MKMTTEIPAGTATPDNLETSIGVLSGFEGVPDAATTQKGITILRLYGPFQAIYETTWKPGDPQLVASRILLTDSEPGT